MKIAIVGAGAIGGLFGAILAQNGQDVTLVDIWEEHVKAIKEAGLILAEKDQDVIVNIKATTKITEVENPDLIIISVKAYDTEQAARDCLKILGSDTVVMTVQNGVGNVKIIGEIVGVERVIAGTTSFGSTVLGPGRIQPNGIGAISIGELDGAGTERLRRIVNGLSLGGIETHAAMEGVDSIIWTKLLANVGINGLTAITQLRNGELLEFAGTKTLQEKVVNEALAVAEALGIRFGSDDPFGHVLDITRGTYTNKSSMRQDIERGSKTEVDYINGAIVKEGARLGIATPVNEIVTMLIKTLEERGPLPH